MDSILRFDVLSLFPKTLEGFTGESIIARAIESGIIEVNSLDIRRWRKVSTGRLTIDHLGVVREWL